MYRDPCRPFTVQVWVPRGHMVALTKGMSREETNIQNDVQVRCHTKAMLMPRCIQGQHGEPAGSTFDPSIGDPAGRSAACW